MKGAGTVSATSPRRSLASIATNVLAVNSSSARARLSNAALPGMGAWTAFHKGANLVNTAFLLPSVGYAFALAFDAQYRAKPDQFLWSVLLTQGLASARNIQASPCTHKTEM